MKNLLALVLVMAFSIGLLAGTALGCQQGKEGSNPGCEEHMRKTQERIMTLRLWKLMEALSLDEEMSLKLFPVIKKYEQRSEELWNSKRGDMDALRAALEADDEAGIEKALNRVEETRSALHELKEAKSQELKDILTVKQQAQYMLFEKSFRREIKKVRYEAGTGCGHESQAHGH
jgi:Spy/CpxP family protein refolding chaperone